jgi:KUP system potassium uptake protein
MTAILTLSPLVTFLWLLFLGGTGIANITHFPGIFRAFDPSRAVLRTFTLCAHPQCPLTDLSAVFVRTRDYDLLAGVLLALTGCEALFAK